MKTRNHKNFYRLLNEHVRLSGLPAEDLKLDFVLSASNGRTESLTELKDVEYATLIGFMEAKLAENRDADGDKWRKRVIAAFCEYYGLMGYYKELKPAERIEKAKGEAVRAKVENRSEKGEGAARSRGFNGIPVCELQALYYGKIRQNRVLRGVNKLFETDLKKDA